MKRISLVGGLVALTLATSALADGGENGGGGNSLPSTPATAEDIKENLKTIKDQAYAGFLRLQLQVTDPDIFPIDGPEFNATDLPFAPVINKIMKAYSLENILQKYYSFQPDIKETGACYEQNEERDASADPVSNKICISLQRLVDRKIPYHDLSFKMTALLIHEVTHLMLLDEADATALQIAFEGYGKMITPGQLMYHKIRAGNHSGYNSRSIVRNLVEGLDSNFGNSAICYKLGQLQTYIFSNSFEIIDPGFVAFGSVLFNVATLEKSGQIMRLSTAVGNFCFGSDRSEAPPLPVPENDRPALRAALLKLDGLMEELLVEIIKPPFALVCEDEDGGCAIKGQP